MSRLDQFESVFKSAAKPTFTCEPLQVARVMVLSDLDPEGAARHAARVRDSALWKAAPFAVVQLVLAVGYVLVVVR